MKTTSLTERALSIIDNRGKSSLDEASRQILQSHYDNGIISNALKYYAKTIFPRVLPIFPTLIYLSCKAAGGNPEKTRPIASAMLLMTASGDIHDDLIDQSTHKFGRKTILGKYGKEAALLAGDALLVQGMELLQKNCEDLSVEQRRVVVNLIKKAMFELVGAEATETCLWKKANASIKQYLQVINQKGTVAELHCRIGGIIGSADKETLKDITSYGRAIGILSVMKDEFMDMLNFSELQHRIQNEIVPYPLFLALQEESFRKMVLPVLAKADFSIKDLRFVTQLTFDSVEVKRVRTELKKFGEDQLATNSLLKDDKGKEAAVLLQALAIEL